MARKARDSARVSVRGVGLKRPVDISARKYEQVSKAILAVLSASPVKFTELARRVGERLPGSAGSVPWYTVTIAHRVTRVTVCTLADPIAVSVSGAV
jgi:hypothetical protein